jgi:hypothetical protein
MDKITFEPKITLDRGLKGPIELDVKHIKTLGPNAIAGSDITLENPGFCLIPSAIHVVESPWRIAVLIGEAVDSWIWGVRRAEDEQKEQKNDLAPAVETGDRQHKEHKEGGLRLFEAIHAGVMAGPSHVQAYKLNSRPLEIPGKDAVKRCPYCHGPGGDYRSVDYPAINTACSLVCLSRAVDAEIQARKLEKLEGVSEAGDERVKPATGHGVISMGKLREALGALQHPGAQIVAKGMAATKFGGPMPPVGKCSFCGGAHLSEDHTALGSLGYTVPDRLEAQAATPEPPKDRLRDVLAQFAASLDARRKVGMVTVGEIETLIIQTLEAGGKITIDAAGHEFRADAPPDRREYFKSRRGH